MPPTKANRSNITDERAARRFHQMAVLERQLTLPVQIAVTKGLIDFWWWTR